MTRPYFIWISNSNWRHFNVHRSRDCHRLAFTVGKLGFRWEWDGRSAQTLLDDIRRYHESVFSADGETSPR